MFSKIGSKKSHLCIHTRVMLTTISHDDILSDVRIGVARARKPVLSDVTS